MSGPYCPACTQPHAHHLPGGACPVEPARTLHRRRGELPLERERTMHGSDPWAAMCEGLRLWKQVQYDAVGHGVQVKACTVTHFEQGRPTQITFECEVGGHPFTETMERDQ